MSIPLTRTDRILNRSVGWLARRGWGMAGARELRTVGRRSGLPRSTPVNPFVVDSVTYLVSPRGVTDWVRNTLTNPDVELRVGRKITPYRAVPVTDPAVRIAALREYYRVWAWEIGRFFPELPKHPTAEQLAATDRPVFRLESR